MAVENFDGNNDKSNVQVSDISVFSAGVGGSISQAINEWREASGNRTDSSTQLHDLKISGLDSNGSEKGINAPTPQPNRAAFDARPEDTNKVREQDYKNDLSQKRSVTGDELRDTSGPKNQIPEDHRITVPPVRNINEKGINEPVPQPHRSAFDARPEDTNKAREQDYKNDLSQKRSITGDDLRDTSGPKNKISEDHRINVPPVLNTAEKGIVPAAPVPLRSSLEADKKSPRLDGIQNDLSNKRSVSPEELRKVDGPVNKIPKDVLDRLFPPPVKYAAGDK